MKEGLALLLAKFRVGIVQHEPDSGKEITLSRAIPSHNHIHSGTKGPHNHLVSVGFESMDRQLEAKCMSKWEGMGGGVPA